jgi:hypothetical protein
VHCGDALLRDAVIGSFHGGSLLSKRIRSPILCESGLRTAAQPVTEYRTPSYTTQRYINAWKQTFSAYSSTFPRQYFSLALHLGLPIPDRTQRAYVRDQILSLGLQYPSQFALQADGLNGDPSKETYGDRVVRDYSGQVVTGFMMDTSALLRSQQMGAEGDPPLALRKSIDKGMGPNDSGQHIKYLEIYETDVLADEMQPVLRYGASLVARKQ